MRVNVSLKLKSDEKRKTKGIPKAFSKKFHNHDIFKKALYNKPDLNKKVEFYSINLKTEKIIKDNISNFNDKRYMIDNLISKPHE